jgi:hypothetical protein
MGGYRISEILRLTWLDVLPDDRVLVRVAKRGSASLLHLPGVTALRQSLPPDQWPLQLFDCGYTAVYRAMLRKGYAMQPEGHNNRSVTHTPRRLLAMTVAGVAGPTAAGQVINHTSKTAISYYINPLNRQYAIVAISLPGQMYKISCKIIAGNSTQKSIAWELVVRQPGGWINSVGKGFEPGFQENYGQSNLEPQTMPPIILMLYPYWQIKLTAYYTSAVISAQLDSNNHR